MRLPANDCAQRAAAAVLAPRLGVPERALRERLRREHPPDTPLALLGTTPWGLERLLRAQGAEVERRAGATRAWLEAALARGPVLACVDLRPLGHRWPMLHWVVVRGADAEGVTVDGLVRAPWPREGARVPWGAFLRAWACRWAPLPAYRRAALALPTRQASPPG